MDVTILIAPKGCTRNPVALKASTHVYTVPDGVDAEIFVGKAVSRLSNSYHNGVYALCFKDRECHMEEFREYVMRCEQKRCDEIQDYNVRSAYDEAVKIFINRGSFIDNNIRFKYHLRRLMPGISNPFCTWILCQFAAPDGYISLDEFREVVKKAEEMFVANRATLRGIKV